MTAFSSSRPPKAADQSSTDHGLAARATSLRNFRLVVISPEDEHPGELALLPRLFETGLTRYHLRKPAWSRKRLAAHLDAIPAKYHPRIVLHSHHDLAATPPPFRSRSLHSLTELKTLLATTPPNCDSAFLSPLFPSISKNGYIPNPDALPPAKLAVALHTRPWQRRPEIIALGGITPARLSTVAHLGFDGAAILGAIWQSPDPLATWSAFQSKIENQRSKPPLPPVICITHDKHPLGDHPAQAQALCAAGAKHIQLRTKNAPPERWLTLAREVTAICHEYGALCIINDSPEIAHNSGADGVHLGTQDAPWSEARCLLGPDAIIGGTVNNADHARAAAAAHAAGNLDYIGIGPLRHTATKQKLAPILGIEGIHHLLTQSPPLPPSFVIGGILADDLPAIRQLGTDGVAVSGALLNAQDIFACYRDFLSAWFRNQTAYPARPSSL